MRLTKSICLLVAVFLLLVYPPLLAAPQNKAESAKVVSYDFEVMRGDSNGIMLHVSERLGQTSNSEFGGFSPSVSAAAMKRDLQKLDGVTAVFIEPYRFNIFKGQVFDWEQIKPNILKVLKTRFAINGELKQVQH